MASIDLPRALQDYFAFAETTPTRNGRRFSITLPYVRPDGRLDKLQWWYHLSPAKEKALGDRAPESLRTEAIGRFQVHIERWLENTAQVMYGEGAIPRVIAESQPRAAIEAPVTDGYSDELPETPEPTQSETVWVEQEEVDCAELTECPEIAPDALEPLPAEKTAFG